jgi:hypothetical protein
MFIADLYQTTLNPRLRSPRLKLMLMKAIVIIGGTAPGTVFGARAGGDRVGYCGSIFGGSVAAWGGRHDAKLCI